MKKVYKKKPKMVSYSKFGKTKLPFEHKELKYYDVGTKQVTNKLTGKRGKMESLLMKRISPEEFGGKSKIKLKKKSGGYRKTVKK